MSALAFDCCEMAAGDKTVGFTPKRGEPARCPGGPAARQRGPPGPRSQFFVSAIQSISMSNGPVHSGTQKKIRAGGLVGKKRL